MARAKKDKPTCEIGLGCGASCVDPKKHCVDVLSSSTKLVIDKASKVIQNTVDGLALKDDHSTRSLKRSNDLLVLSKADALLSNFDKAKLKSLYSSTKPTLNEDNAKIVMVYTKNSQTFNSEELRTKGSPSASTKLLTDHLDHALYRLPSENSKTLTRLVDISPEANAKLLDKYDNIAKSGKPFTENGYLTASAKDDFKAGASGIKFHIDTADSNSKARDIAEYSADQKKSILFGRGTDFAVTKVDKATGEVWLTELNKKALPEAETKTLSKDEILAKSKAFHDKTESLLDSSKRGRQEELYGQTKAKFGKKDSNFMSLNRYDAMAIVSYVDSSADHNLSGLRKGKTLEELAPKGRVKIEHMDHALAQLPSVKSGTELYRGVKVTNAQRSELLDRYEDLAKSKKTISEPAFSSTSRLEHRAKLFADSSTYAKIPASEHAKEFFKPAPGEYNNGIVFAIKASSNSNGKDIENFRTTYRVSNEKEVLFMRDTAFRIDKVDRAQGKIWMSEV